MASRASRTAVVKANYVKTAESDAGRRVSASVDYYGQDKDIDGSYKGELEAFDHERDNLTREETNAFHEEKFGEHKYCYRTTLSPGTDLGPDEMREFVRDTMSDLEEIRGHEIDYQAYVHDDHEHPHAHVVFYEDTTLRKAELNEWREEATVHAHELDNRFEPELSSQYEQQLDVEMTHNEQQPAPLYEQQSDEITHSQSEPSPQREQQPEHEVNQGQPEYSPQHAQHQDDGVRSGSEWDREREREREPNSLLRPKNHEEAEKFARLEDEGPDHKPSKQMDDELGW